MPSIKSNDVPGAFGRGPQTRFDEMSRILASNWWAIALRGVFAVVFGIVALFMPAVAILSLVLVAGAYFFIEGVFGIISAWRAAQHHKRWGWLTFEGIMNILAGLFAFFWPGWTVLAFVLLLGVSSIISGVLMLAAAFQFRGSGRGWLFFSAVVSVAFGAILLVSPVPGAVVLTYWIGIYAIIFGAGLIVLSFKLRKFAAL